MNEKNYDFRNETGTYQTGRTEPPKRYGGLVAFLLVLVILLSGISTALSILNLKLYWQLNERKADEVQVAFYHAQENLPAVASSHAQDTVLESFLGFSGTPIPQVHQRYYKLPNGIYITKVPTSTEAALKGLVTGDVLLAINQIPVWDTASLEQAAGTLRTGETVDLTIYRSGTEFSVSLTWGQ